MFGDRMPGTRLEVCESILGRVPEDIEFRPTRRRYPVVALRYPYVFAVNPRRVHAAAEEQRAWYRRHLDALPGADLSRATAAFVESTERLQRAVSLQALTLLSSIQPLWQAVEEIVDRTGVGDSGVFSGTGGARPTSYAICGAPREGSSTSRSYASATASTVPSRESSRRAPGVRMTRHCAI